MTDQRGQDADQRGQVERHIEGAFGSRHTTTYHSLDIKADSGGVYIV